MNEKKICEGDNETIQCLDDNVIEIIFASYGRNEDAPEDCHGLLEFIVEPDNSCLSSKSLTTIKTKCNDRKRCNIKPTNKLFEGDPCQGTNKYLLVKYNCVAKERQSQPAMTQTSTQRYHFTSRDTTKQSFHRTATGKGYSPTTHKTQSTMLGGEQSLWKFEITPPNQHRNDPTSDASQLQSAKIAGMALGAFAGFLILLLVALIIIKRYRKTNLTENKELVVEERPNELYEMGTSFNTGANGQNTHQSGDSTKDDNVDFLSENDIKNHSSSIIVDNVLYGMTDHSLTSDGNSRSNL